MTCCNYSVPPWQWKSGLHPECRPCLTFLCTPCCLSVCCPWPSFWPCGCTATVNLLTATWIWARWDGPYITLILIWRKLCHFFLLYFLVFCTSHQPCWLLMFMQITQFFCDIPLIFCSKGCQSTIKIGRRIRHIFLVCLGSRTHSPLSFSGSETTAAFGNQS